MFADNSRTVVVTGDFLIEYRFTESSITTVEFGTASLDPSTYMELFRAGVGAASLGGLIKSAMENWPRASVKPRVISAEPRWFANLPHGNPYWHSYLVCAQFPKQRGGRDKDLKPIWRVKQKLGVDRASKDALDEFEFKEIEHGRDILNFYERADRGNAQLIVVEQAQHGFARDAGKDGKRPTMEVIRKRWPKSLLALRRDTWLLVEWSSPNFKQDSDFWKYIARRGNDISAETRDANFRNRIVVVVTIEDLRLFGMRISRSLSWERTIEDLCREVKGVWDTSFKGCKHLVVSFNTSGAALFTDHGNYLTAKLVYDPAYVEGAWASRYEGDMSGFTRCITAGVALELIHSRNPNVLVGSGAKAGVAAARFLLANGFLVMERQARKDTALPGIFEFPEAAVAKVLRTVLGAPSLFRVRRKPQRSARLEYLDRSAALDARAILVQKIPLERDLQEWKILNSRLSSNEERTFRLAREITRYGSRDRSWVFPIARIGEMFLTDRGEMESVRAVSELMTNYIASSIISTPLSIAVFGPPGSGKSFAIKELAANLTLEDDIKVVTLTFNLSQFMAPDGIASALQQVRDVSLSGSMPLVFWDEFDTNYQGALGWLRYFLAPMQDGKFQDGSVTHNVGRAIFVFAGGTHSSMKKFVDRVEDKDIGPEIKLPDFISRLRGSIDVPTLNYGVNLDPAIALRRAVLLRSFLQKSAGALDQSVPTMTAGAAVLRNRLNIDRGVLEAFLRVKNYRYAARSMEAIVKMSALSGRVMYDRSSLPPFDQLELHVSANEFLELVEHEWAGSESGTARS